MLEYDKAFPHCSTACFLRACRVRQLLLVRVVPGECYYPYWDHVVIVSNCKHSEKLKSLIQLPFLHLMSVHLEQLSAISKVTSTAM